MKGIILDFSIQTNTGIISGEDSQRYSFAGSEWKEATPPQRGMHVDFDTNNQKQAFAVYQAMATSSVKQSPNNSTEKSEENYNLFDWFIKCLKNYANFSGRARRKEFWLFYLSYVIFNLISMVLDVILESEVIFYGLTNLVLFIPFLAVSARRLHDINRSGWWYLLSLTIIGLIPLIIWWAQERQNQDNQYSDPVR